MLFADYGKDKDMKKRDFAGKNAFTKTYRITKLYITVFLVLGIVAAPWNGIKAQAVEILATVNGTVLSGTNSELLKLSTREGYMEIKLDSGTDITACKILLPDKRVSVAVTYGSDGYLHAAKISSETQEASVTLDTSSTATVTGKIGDKTTGSVLHVATPQGEMEIKLDATTDVSGCSLLVVGKSYNITCVRGSDAYMHAARIYDTGVAMPATIPVTNGTAATAGTPTVTPAVNGNTENGTAASSITPAPAAPVGVETVSVSGTVTSNTKEGLLYLSTNEGEMQLVIDSNTDTRSGVVLTPGNKLTVSCYRGSDAYMHAASVVGVKDGAGAVEIDRSSPATVTGTVGSKSTENVLYLSTSGGEMQLKLDAVNSISNCKAFVSGKKLTVTCARGSDAYMHALDIVGN